jgi:hypothetical protein
LAKKQIFFVGRTMKSGTTWLQLLLNAHPQVSRNGEAHFVASLAPSLKQGLDLHWEYIECKNRMVFHELEGYQPLAEEDFSYILSASIALFLMRQSKGKEAAAIGERSANNTKHLDRLNALFARAKFIQIVRDGRDCAVSAWFHNLRVTPQWTKQKHGSLDAYATSYAEGWSKDLAKAQEFADRHRDRFYRVRYEDLASETERVLAGVFRFLGVACDEAVLGRQHPSN